MKVNYVNFKAIPITENLMLCQHCSDFFFHKKSTKSKFTKNKTLILKLSQTIPGFKCLQYKSFENTVGKREIARKSNFSFFPTVFSTLFGELSAIFIKFRFVVSKFCQFEGV